MFAQVGYFDYIAVDFPSDWFAKLVHLVIDILLHFRLHRLLFYLYRLNILNVICIRFQDSHKWLYNYLRNNLLQYHYLNFCTCLYNVCMVLKYAHNQFIFILRIHSCIHVVNKYNNRHIR